MSLLFRTLLCALALVFVFDGEAQAACLTKLVAVDAKTDRPLTIHVPDEDSASYQGKGFARAACPADSMASAAAFRDSICHTARTGNEAVQARILSLIGESPKRLCEAAERLTGAHAQPLPRKPGRDGGGEQGQRQP